MGLSAPSWIKTAEEPETWTLEGRPACTLTALEIYALLEAMEAEMRFQLDILPRLDP